jgi:hypothetical protein
MGLIACALQGQNGPFDQVRAIDLPEHRRKLQIPDHCTIE